MIVKPKSQIDQNQSDGLVWIQDGQVFVKNEEKDGMPPIINPCEGVKLYINGVECKHLTAVSEDDDIELKTIEIEMDSVIDVEISEDKLKCYLIYSPAERVSYKIADANPVNRLDIQVTRIILETKKITEQAILDYLKGAGIVFGIRMNTLVHICEDNQAGKFLIAEGKPAVDTEDTIEYFFMDDGSKEQKLEEDELGNVDFRNISSHESVSIGQIIAQIRKGEPGPEGMTVTGEIIVPENLRIITIMPTVSIIYDEKSGIIRANKSGRPTKKEVGDAILFQIFDTVQIDEVNMKTGNVKFKGDVEVKKNICESMEVIARQNVLVRGNVEFASIFAGNNIIVKGSAITSKINAAMNDVVAKDPSPLMEKLIEGIEKLLGNIRHVSVQEMSANHLDSFPSLVWYLLNSKNKDLPLLVYDVIASLRKDNYDIEDSFILNLMQKTRSLMGYFSEIQDEKYLYQIISDLRVLYSGKNTSAVKGNITLNMVTNCDVSALGDIKVLGKGCVNSNITCNGKVTVSGYVRGGQIRAEKGIEIYVAGSERGTKTLLVVPEDSYIQIRSAYSDTTVKIGNMSYTFLSEVKMVRARLENGKLLF